MRHSPVTSVGASRRLLNHAIVLGGSIAGLLAARVLSDHFAHVTVVSGMPELKVLSRARVSHKATISTPYSPVGE